MTKSFFTTLGLIWLIIEVISYFSEYFKKLTEGNITFLICVSLVSVIIAFLYNLPRREVSKDFLNLNTSVKIEIGELLDKKGNILIASSDYFDTATSKTNSIKKQLIKKFFNNATDYLDEKITDSLKSQNIQGELVSRDIKPIGKQIRYSIGDTVDINLPSDSQTKIFICVICEVIYSGTSKSKSSDYRKLLTGLENSWKHIRNTNNQDIYLPILGSGVSGLSLSKLTLCQLITLSYLLYSKTEKVGKSMTIVIPERNYDPELFEEMHKFLSSIEI